MLKFVPCLVVYSKFYKIMTGQYISKMLQIFAYNQRNIGKIFGQKYPTNQSKDAICNRTFLQHCHVVPYVLQHVVEQCWVPSKINCNDFQCKFGKTGEEISRALIQSDPLKGFARVLCRDKHRFHFYLYQFSQNQWTNSLKR